VDDTLYIQTRSPGSEDTWVTVAAVRKNDLALAHAIEEIFAVDHAGDGMPVRVHAAAELHSLGGPDAVARAEQQADTPEARNLRERAAATLDRRTIDPD
jgi:hypothetical protein